MQNYLKVPSVVAAVYSRAVRNCPWVGSLWANALRALELKATLDLEEHTKLYAAALQAGWQLVQPEHTVHIKSTQHC